MSFKRIAALCAALLTIAMTPVAIPVLSARAESLEEMMKQSEKLQKEAKELDRIIKSQQKNLTDQKAYVKALEDKINNYAAQIDVLINRINKMEENINGVKAEISEKEAEIEAKENELQERFQVLRQRLRSLSKTGSLSALQMLLNTDSYVDYLIKSEIMRRIAENDKRLMDELEAEITLINADKQKLEEKRNDLQKQLSDVQKLKKQSDNKKKELEVLSSQKNAEIAKLTKSLNTNWQRYKTTLEEYQQTEAKIRAIIEQMGTDGKYGGLMFWPVPAVRNITSFYGKRWGRLHKGIDIAGGGVPAYGQNIVAAASGTVIFANKTNSWGGGYGYYLIIDHGLDSKGRKISTLYAHCSKILVNVGDKVIGGKTVVALVGNTGDSTGPHLHFEVRVNSVAVDPIANGYIKW